MAVGLFNDTLYDFASALPPIFSNNIGWIAAVLKALGILAIAYLIYLIIMLTINVRKIKQLGRIRQRMEIMASG